MRTYPKFGLQRRLYLRFGIEEKGGRYRLTAFVNNLFDEHYTSGMRNGSPLYITSDAFSQMLPRNAFRYWGVTAQYNFYCSGAGGGPPAPFVSSTFSSVDAWGWSLFCGPW